MKKQEHGIKAWQNMTRVRDDKKKKKKANDDATRHWGLNKQNK